LPPYLWKCRERKKGGGSGGRLWQNSKYRMSKGIGKTKVNPSREGTAPKKKGVGGYGNEALSPSKKGTWGVIRRNIAAPCR